MYREFYENYYGFKVDSVVLLRKKGKDSYDCIWVFARLGDCNYVFE